ncbi:universal stress protein family [Candidatus Scalindua japonica]|uniref:Universal stress protein n=1 Tax=Candidatus Scalindua japonica TaxID=1284222 RepID=A0A286TXJ5_9BACT|nr:universal stress protein [Candidatus Scalindua japonica]GAX60584.1 universal stress protein family [Candidatus Scalindua japonica]
MKMLVAVDLSGASQKILQYVKTLASDLSAKVWVVYAEKPESGFVGFGTGRPQSVSDQVAQDFNKKCEELQNEVEKLRAIGIDAEPLLAQGVAVEVILDEASKLNADLIVVGSHGHGAVYHLMVGSVSEGVLHRSTCPVLVVPTHDRTEQKK